MKKKLLLLTLVLTMLVSLLSSCSFLEQLGINLGGTSTPPPTTTADPAPKTAEELVGLIGETMDELASYEARGTMDFTFFIEGIEVKAQTVTTEIVIDNEIDDYYYYNKEASFFEAEALGISESSVSLDAYHDGYYFLLREEDGVVTQKLTSRISREKAIELQEKQAFKSSENEDDFDPFNCTGKSFEKKADGTYTLSLSGYTATAIDSFWGSMDNDEDIFDVQLLDLNITITADNEYRIKQMQMVFVFKEADDPLQTPSASFTINMSAYNAATKKTDELDLANYPGANNLDFIYDAERLWNERAEAKEGSFILKTDETLYYGGRRETVDSEVNYVIYGNNPNGYYYSVSSTTQDEGETLLEYSNGKIKVTQDGQTQTVPYTEKDAKEFISELILIGEYDPDRVKSISYSGNGIYTLTVHSTFDEEMSEIFASFDAALYSVKQTFTFTVTDGELSHVCVRVVGEAAYQGSVISYIITGELTFREVEQPGDTISLVK